MSIVKLNNNGVKNATEFGSITGLGSMIFLSKQTASSSSTISFTSGINSTYKEYLFTFNNVHPASDGVYLQFQGNAAGGSGYNETITSSYFIAYHFEDGSSSALSYSAGGDLAQGTGFQRLSQNVGNDNDQCASGYLHLFEPSSTTYIKNFIGRTTTIADDNGPVDAYTSGYFNITSAIDEIQFKMSSGNMDFGNICLYGLST